MHAHQGLLAVCIGAAKPPGSGGPPAGAQFSLSSEYLGLISFRMDWLDLLAVQGTLKSLLQKIETIT